MYGNHENFTLEFLEQKQFLLECMIILTFFSCCIKAGDSIILTHDISERRTFNFLILAISVYIIIIIIVYYVRISYNVVLSSRSLHFVSCDLTDTYYYALSEN